MASTSNLGLRRNAAQLHALAGVEREVQANDSCSRRKYLRDFSQAFRDYDALIDSRQLRSLIHAADIILVGDYHALPAAQRYAASVLEERAQPGDRPVVLGVETIFSRHQHVLDEWWRREIDADELRERIRFEAEWGYDWSPFYELLVTAREHGEAVYGLDCMPREDLRKIRARDRHAVDKIAEIRQRHPNAVIVVLFGESHLAPHHLPVLLRQRLPDQRVLTILQNVDDLYWAATSERQERVEAVQVSNDVVCVFNSTPLEKYESYRLCLSRWRQEDACEPDLAPTIYNLIDSLLSFLDINRYCSHNSTQPKFLVDLLPEVYCGSSDGRLRQFLSRAVAEPGEIESMLHKVADQGIVYLPSTNAFYVREFHMMYAAEETARFMHHACRGLPLRKNSHASGDIDPKDSFYVQTVEHALAYFGSRVLYPVRPVEHYRAGHAFSQRFCDKFADQALRADRSQFHSMVRKLGYTLGNQLYDCYLRRSVSRTVLRHLFVAHIDEPGRARQTCAEIIHRIRSSRKKPCGSVRS